MAKRKLLILLCYTFMALLIIGLLFAFAFPLYQWNTMDPVPMNIWIVDKTVPNTDYREHKGLMWVLNSEKIVNGETGAALRHNLDYYGFFPIDKDHYDIKELAAQDIQPDLIYLADTYGVYKDDYLSVNTEGSRSELLYGGLNDEESALIMANLGGINTIIGEFNTASAPTNFVNRQQLGEIFRINWLGWSGRYFLDLTKGVEVPTRTVFNYEAQNGDKWTFEGEGFVLVSDDDRVIVLRKGIEIGNNNLTFSFEKSYFDEFGIDKVVPYDYWFEFTQANPSADILANYQMDLTQRGKIVFNELGLSQTFPAIIRSENTQYNAYYFAGDFADSTNSGKWSNFYGYSKLKSTLTFGAKGANSEFYWKCYVPMIRKILSDVSQHKSEVANLTQPQKIQYNARVSGAGFQILQGNQWTDFYAKGVNIGSSTPGKAFTEFPRDETLYIDWFEKITSMNANTIRVYTLQSAQFYNALAFYNRTHPDAVLWLYQEIWPEENPENGDYLAKDYNETYQKEIENAIDAVHGMANIPPRIGRAYGIYTSDVSAYIAGYLVGRELEPAEVISTDQLNQNFSYMGEYLYCETAASPTEAWLAMSCDYTLAYEAKQYGWQHPVGIVSWPTLDPMQHDSEWNISNDKALEYNDKVSVDINHISVKDTVKAGLFGAYHIYPNYPDFMNNEESYASYQDEEGIFRYGGYLQEFMQNHKKYPALVAEFGLSTGMGNAHANPDGYNHGGLTELAQGEGVVRMMKAIQREGYAGGLIFEWTDEWAKKTWTTEPFMIPFDRNVLWKNAVDPEQNYGIFAMESSDQKAEPYAINGTGVLQEIKLSADETYLGMEISLGRSVDFSKETLIIGLDTYDRSKGNAKYSNDIVALAPSGLEFEIKIAGMNDARLLVQPDYNVTKNSYSSVVSPKGEFENMTLLINKERTTKSGVYIGAVYFDESKLNYGTLKNNSHNSWVIEGNQIRIRIPWTRINFTDPSGMRVLDDTDKSTAPVTDELNTAISEGILVSGLLVDQDTNQVIATIGVKENQFSMGYTQPLVKNDQGVSYTARAEGKDFYVLDAQGAWQKTFLAGVNIGLGVPGSFPGEFAIEYDTYFDWFTQIGDMGANVIRVYTPQSPGFYHALYEYNRVAAIPLYLMQGVYMDESDVRTFGDLFAPQSITISDMRQDIVDCVDMLHGNAVIGAKPGKASGVYQYDVSQYVIGWILGIECEAYLVDGTNQAHPEITEYNGKYVYTENASPFEVFIAQMQDLAIAYETDQYHMQRPVAFTNWITTDPLSHPNEPRPEEDGAVINVEHIKSTSSFTPGLFASYHVYPYYPDFLNFPTGDPMADENSYYTYVKSLVSYHSMPVLIAEFGLPTSRGVTHINHLSGLNQGGNNEQRQGDGLAQMLTDIHRSGCMGGIVFAWQDEWFKTSWNIMDFDDNNARPKWFNVESSEENFGLIGFSAFPSIRIDGDDADWGEVANAGDVKADWDEAYLYLRVAVENFNGQTYYVPIDTIGGEGSSGYQGMEFQRAADFVLVINGEDNTRLLIDPYYDPNYKLYKTRLFSAEELADYTVMGSGRFNTIRQVISDELRMPETGQVIPIQFWDTGKMRYGSSNPADPAYDSLADFCAGDGFVELRIPWMLLNFADPSSGRILANLHTEQPFDFETIQDIYLGVGKAGDTATVTMNGYRLPVWGNFEFTQRPKLSYAVLQETFPQVATYPIGREEALSAALSLQNTQTENQPFAWAGWNIPTYQERLKDSYSIIQSYFGTIE